MFELERDETVDSRRRCPEDGAKTPSKNKVIDYYIK